MSRGVDKVQGVCLPVLGLIAECDSPGLDGDAPNKIDLPAADPMRVKHEIEDIIGIPALDAPEISAS